MIISVLDTAIRDWVLIPLSVVMVLIGILRYFVSKLMRSSPAPDAKMVKEGQVIIRARNLIAGTNFIPPKSFRARRFYLATSLILLWFIRDLVQRNVNYVFFHFGPRVRSDEDELSDLDNTMWESEDEAVVAPANYISSSSDGDEDEKRTTSASKQPRFRNNNSINDSKTKNGKQRDEDWDSD